MTEQNKAPAPATEHPYPPPVIQYPQPYNGAYPPPPPPGTSPYPPYFYPPPADGAHGENGQPGMPPGAYMMLAPPGVVYVHPPPPQGQPFASPSAAVAAASQPAARPKRKQVKMACTNCAAACKRCDENRPCERCQKYGIAESCVDGQRKERKKGIKRGPYKRKNKAGPDSPGYTAEWPPSGTQPQAAAAAIHAVATQLSPEAAGYYQPIFYPPPHTYLSHPPEGQPGPDGAPPHVNGQPPLMQYYIHPGAGYPPYPHPYPAMYPHPPPPPPGAAPPPGTPATPAAAPAAPAPATSAPPAAAAEPPAPAPPTTVNPADTSKKDDAPEPNGTTTAAAEPAANGKKRSRGSKGSEAAAAKSKKAKPSSAGRPVRMEGVREVGGQESGVEGVGNGVTVPVQEGAAADASINPALS